MRMQGCLSGLTLASSHVSTNFNDLKLPFSRFSMTASTTAASDLHDGTRADRATPSPVVHIYPYPTLIQAVQSQGRHKYTTFKKVHWIRHAQGVHNVNKEYRSLANLDAKLTGAGVAQCRALSDRIAVAASRESAIGDPLYDIFHKTELIITSPLTRCVQTSLLCLDRVIGNRDVPVVAHEGIRETVNYNCDRRRPTGVVATEYPVDFSFVDHAHDQIWELYERRLGDHEKYPYHRESAEIYKVAERARKFFEWLRQQPQENVVVCSHAAFSRCLWNYGLPGHVPNLPEQHLDERQGPELLDIPIVQYPRDDKNFEQYIRSDFDNCEMRSMLLAFI